MTNTFHNPIIYQALNSCRSDNNNFYYFNSSRLSCFPCSQNKIFQQISSDGLSCKCTMLTKLVLDFGGEITCEMCPPDFIQGFDPWECVECNSNCSLDAINQDQIQIQRELDGSFLLDSPSQIIKSCANFTSPDSSNSRCFRCDQILSVTLLNNTDCICSNLANGLCFREQSDYPFTSLDQLFSVSFSGRSIISFYFSIRAQAAVGMCRQGYWNTSACQNLANLCVFTLYSNSPQTTCENFISISSSDNIDAWGWPSYIPWIFYNKTKPKAQIIGPDVTIPITYSFGDNVNLKVGVYSPDGIFLNFYGVENGRLQLCKGTNNFLNSAFIFGNYFTQNCQIEGKLLWNEETYKPILYDLWVEYFDEQTRNQILYALPLQLTDSESFYRRFFLVDNLSGKESSLANAATYVRYAKEMTLTIQLADSRNGSIFPPLLHIVYDVISYTDAFQNNISVQVKFEVKYSMHSITSITSTISIITGVLSGFAVLLSLFETWSWFNRSGQRTIDLVTLFKFLLFTCNHVSTVLFLMLAFGCSVWWIIFKFQGPTNVVTSKALIDEYIIYISLAYSFKMVHIIHSLYMQINAEVFFIDWEKSSGEKTGGSSKKLAWLPSAQREYECARRWAELQTLRAAGSPTFRLIFTAFLLQVCGFGNLATLDSLMDFNPSDDDSYHAPMSICFRFGIIVLIYFSIALMQWLVYKIFYERYITNPILEFIDYLSWANISMVAFENRYFGYYVHGRSVHGRGDLSILELRLAILQEQKGICSKRGLEPNSEDQTFIVCFPRKLRSQYDQIMQPTNLFMNKYIQDKQEQYKYLTDVHTLLTNLFHNFIDQIEPEMKYVVTNKTLLEELFSFEAQNVSNIGRFYRDNGQGFENLLMRGEEISWIIVEVLFFGLMDLALEDYLFDAALTYFIIEVFIKRIRIELSLFSIAKSTLLDKKFITVHNT